MVEFYVHPLEVLLWEILIFMNTAICIYLIYKEKKREFREYKESKP